MINQKSTYGFCLLLAALLISGCYYDVQEELHPNAYTQACDTSSISYSNQVTSILLANCTSCHKQGLASGNIALDNYAGVIQVVNNGKLVGAIDQEAGFRPMPQNAPQLSECDRTIIKKWISNGSTNN